MRIALSNPPWYKIDVAKGTGLLGCRAGSRWPHMRDYRGSMVSRYQPFPFFLATASAMLKKARFDVVLHDSIVIGETYDDYYRFMALQRPDVLLMETSTPSIQNDIGVAKKIKELLPDTILVFAGLHMPLRDAGFLREVEVVDYAIYGEYEHPFLLLCQCLVHRSDVSMIPNLVYRKNGCVLKTKPEKLLAMSEFPWPDRDALPNAYYDGCGGMLGLELQVMSSRGCPFRCNYCVLPEMMYQHTVRLRDPEDTIREISHHIIQQPYTHFYFDDDTINANRFHFLTLCKLIRNSPLKDYPWACMGRADLMDDDLLQAMKEAGCYSIKYGIESLQQSVLDRSGKAMELEKAIEIVKKTEDLGIRVHLTYCLGMLGDTVETVEDTIQKSLELRADSRQYSICTPFAGSMLWQYYNAKGMIISEDCNCYDANHTVVVNREELPAAKLAALKHKADQLSKEQLRNMVTSQFRTNDFANRLLQAICDDHKILIIRNIRTAITRKIAGIVCQSAEKTDVLIPQKYIPDFEMLPEICLIPQQTGDCLCEMSLEQQANLITTDYDVVIVPGQAFTMEEMRAEIVIAKQIAKKVIVICGQGKIEILNENTELKRKEEKNETKRFICN